MADPIVTITNGVPTASVPSSGTITTLGMTLVDGANATFGATTDVAVTAGAAGSISAKLRSISRDIVGGISLQAGAAVIGAVTQSGGPWSVSGTVNAAQSGPWSITNISGTVSLPTGAATSAAQPTNAALGSTTLGQTGNLDLGAVTTAAPTYTNGQSNALSLTTAGALRVDGSGVTQPVSGTLTANQGGAPWTVKPDGTAWGLTGSSANVNVSNASIAVTGTFWQATQPISAASLPLPSGASTAALQPTNAAQGSSTTGQTGTLMQAAVLTGAPAYTTGQTSPLSLTTVGALRVDGSAVTQPVSGTVSAAQSGNWSTRMLDGSGNAITSDARGTERPLSVQILDGSGNQITTFGGSGGTASSFGSSFPLTGTAIGAKDSAGLNMQPLNLNASGALKVDGSAVTQPVSGTFWQATQPVSGTFWQTTQPISAASLPLPGGAATSANQTNVQGVIGNATAPANMNVVGGVFNTTKPTLTTGQSAAIQVNSSGIQLVDGSAVTQPISGSVSITGTPAISGTVTANQGGNWTSRIVGNAGGIVDAAQNAVAPANEIVAGGVYNSAAPTLTSGNASQLQLDSSGNLNVNVKVGGGTGGTSSSFGSTFPTTGTAIGAKNGANMVNLVADGSGNLSVTEATTSQLSVATGTTADTAWTGSGTSTIVGALKGIYTSVNGSIPAGSSTIGNVNQAGTWSVRIVGNVGSIFDAAQNAAAPANEVVVGGVYNSTAPTLTSGNASQLQLDSSGNLNVNIKAGAGSGGTSSTIGGSMPTTATVAMGSVTTTAPTYTTATANSLSLNTAGGLRVDGSGVTQPVSGTFWQATQPVSIAAHVTVDQGTAGSAWPVTLTSTTITGTVSVVGATANSADAVATSSTNVAGVSYNYGFNGTTWDRLQVDGSKNLKTIVNAALPAGSAIIGKVTTDQTTPGTTDLVHAAQQGTWTVQPGNTANTTAWLVTGTGGTFPITAASLPLPSGAATSALQSVVQGVIGAATAPTTMSVGGGVFNTTKPTLTTGQSSAIQLNSSGIQLVDGSAVTQPVSGTFWQATQPISAASLPLPSGAATSANQTATSGVIGAATAPTNMNVAGGVFNTTKPTLTTGQSAAMQLNSSGIQLVDLSLTGANATALKVDGSGVTQPVSIAAAVTVQQSTAANLNATVTGTVAATQSGNWTARIVGNAGVALDAAQNAAAPANELVVGGVYNSAAPTITSGNATQLQTDVNGNLKVNIAVGGGAGGTSSTVGAAMPSTATVAMGSVTTSAPGYTTATANALSLNTSGGLRVDGSGVTQPVSGTFWQATQPVSIAAAVTVSQATAANLNATVVGTVTANQGTPPWLVGGDIANAATDSGNPVKIGGVARTADPTAVSTGQRVNGYFDKVGKLIAVNSVRSLRSSTYSTFTTTTEAPIVGATLNIFNDIYGLIVTNTSASVAIIDFRTTSGGAIVMTMCVPPTDTRGISLTADSAFPQVSLNTSWTAQLRSAVSSVYITALFVQNT